MRGAYGYYAVKHTLDFFDNEPGSCDCLFTFHGLTLRIDFSNWNTTTYNKKKKHLEENTLTLQDVQKKIADKNLDVLCRVNKTKIEPEAAEELERLGIRTANGLDELLPTVQSILQERQERHPSSTIEGIDVIDSVRLGSIMAITPISVNSNYNCKVSNSLRRPGAESSGGVVAEEECDHSDFCIHCLILEGKWHVPQTHSTEIIEPDF
jgi:hypothetical protein